MKENGKISDMLVAMPTEREAMRAYVEREYEELYLETWRNNENTYFFNCGMSVWFVATCMGIVYFGIHFSDFFLAASFFFSLGVAVLLVKIMDCESVTCNTHSKYEKCHCGLSPKPRIIFQRIFSFFFRLRLWKEVVNMKRPVIPLLAEEILRRADIMADAVWGKLCSEKKVMCEVIEKIEEVKKKLPKTTSAHKDKVRVEDEITKKLVVMNGEMGELVERISIPNSAQEKLKNKIDLILARVEILRLESQLPEGTVDDLVASEKWAQIKADLDSAVEEFNDSLVKALTPAPALGADEPKKQICNDGDTDSKPVLRAVK